MASKGVVRNLIPVNLLSYCKVMPFYILGIVCACPYSSNIGLSAMTLYYPVQDKTATRPVYTQNYYTKI